MILSACVNPALDVSAVVDQVEPDRKLRTDFPVHEPGGGGINVARAVRVLGGDSLVVAALGGHTGARVAALVEAEGGSIEVVAVQAETRESFTVRSRGSERQYRFVFPGAHFDHEEVEEFVSTVVASGADANVVVLSGSLAPGVDTAIYRTIIDQLESTKVIVDTSGPAFVQASRAHATIVKPNVNELRSAIGRDVTQESEYIEAARELLDKGDAEHVAVSLGPGGAVLVSRDGGVVRARPPAVRQVSAVGAGDSMVAAMAVELERSGDAVSALEAGVCAGTAAVLTPGSQLCRPDDVATLSSQIVVERFD